jgi:hypothetical protein
VNVDIDDEVASLRKQAAQARVRAAEIEREYGWARAQARSQPPPPLSSVLSDGPIDAREFLAAKKRVAARRMLDREMEASGIAERWRADEARQRRTEETEQHAADLKAAGALGQLFTR